jgi:exonuclease SbcC
MKPVRLALSCIGPYVQPVDVDFGRLGEVFLVCGPTGSGKTTLFDAMVYALYGQVPGTRDPADMVSHYTGDSGDVYVDFSFSIGAETWRVLRRPPRSIARKRGEGTRQLPSEAVLYRLGGSREAGLSGNQDDCWEPVRDKPGEVTEQIEGMLGLSFDEFTRIILLPQGEFQRFLDMNTSDRTEILEKLFPVDAHAAVSELARRAALEARAEAKAADDVIATLATRLGAEPDTALEAAKERMRTALADEESARGTLMNSRLALEGARLVSKAWDELRAAEEENAGLLATQGEIDSIRARLGRAVAAAALHKEMDAGDRSAAQHKRESELHALLAGQLQVLRNQANDMDQVRFALAGLGSSIAAMDRDAGDLAARSAAWERARAAGLALAAAESEVQEAGKAAGLGRERIRSIETALVELEHRLPDRAALSDQLSQATAARESARLVSAKAAEGQTLRKGLEKAEADILEAAGRLESSTFRLEAAESMLARAEAMQAEAAIPALAASLSPGCPCPVCGSLDHPAPAFLPHLAEAEEPACSTRPEQPAATAGSGQASSKADLDQARAELRLAGRAEAECRSRLEALVQARSDLNQRLLAFGDVPPPAEASRLLALAESAVSQVQASLHDADTQAASIAALRSELGQARQDSLAAEARLTMAGQSLASAKAAVHEAGKAAGGSDPAAALADLQARRQEAEVRKAAMEKELAAWESGLATAASRMADCQVRLDQAGAELAVASAAAEKALAAAGFADREAWEAACMHKAEHAALADRAAAYAASMAASAARLSAARRAVDGSTRPDTEVLQDAAAAAEEAHTLARTALSQAESALKSVESDCAALAAARVRRESLRERGDRLVELAGLLNGDTAGRRLSFRNFVLARYFSRVAQRASVRLREMSEGRYDIRVVEGKSRGQGRIGLDLEVLDGFTGRARPASSLSGGEKFLSSISLALGLSDVITRRSGGIVLDSIFIDEGFGSLDDETLDRAVAVLDRIRGQRIIGIVSHVAELRTRIPARIEVDKTGNGSSLRIIGG